MSQPVLSRDVLPKAVGLIGVSTLLLTLAFLGILAIASKGGNPGIQDRAPVYLLLAAAVFVTFIVLLEQRDIDGRTVLVSTSSIAVATGAMAWLVGEGVVYTINNRSEVLASQTVVYLLAAAVACTGLFYWTLNHWREFTV
ncbi:MAG TPA: hypothetical protein VKA37_09240 [Halobacteriales archaeon]|nr:hypothetical protein [Halobacteriales archaeon]